MAGVVQWLLFVAGAGFFAVGAMANADAIFGLSRTTRRAKEEGRFVSPIPFVPGIIGALAIALGPVEVLQPWWPVALLLDAGCLPYAIVALFVVVFGGSATDSEAESLSAEEQARRAEIEARRVRLERALTGCVLGTAVGDALGLPYEGLSPARRQKMFPELDRYHLLPGRGMCSDDTEHTLMLAQSLYESAELADPALHAQEVARAFAARLRIWLLAVPAGVGWASLRAILKLWLFIPPRWSGVRSAGNAPAMRSAILGVLYGDSPDRVRELVRASTRISHTDPKAEQAAWTVARAAHWAAVHGARVDANAFVRACEDGLGSEAAEWLALLDRVAQSVQRGEATREFAESLGLAKGVTGYAFHTVPVALHAWLSRPGEFRGALLSAIECGGDTDTVGAIVGAVAGAGVGKEGIPRPWLDRLVEWPRNVAWMEAMCALLAKRQAVGILMGEPMPKTGALRLLLRNVFFLAVVLAHGFRRLLPPY